MPRRSINLTPLIVLVLAAVAVTFAPRQVGAREEIRIVGSSTVYPFATTVADRFGAAPGHHTPVIESTGTGGGFKLFCAGVGVAHPDIANASRPMKDSERAACAEAGVDAVTEIKIGFDGIVLARARGHGAFNLTLRQIFLALAKRVPRDGVLVDNPFKRWGDIDPALPDRKIAVLGPPPTSGTRDAFVELAMEGGCGTFPEIAALKKSDKGTYRAVCHGIREDGAYIEAGENDNLIVQKLNADKDSLGIIGFGFLEENRDILRAATIAGVAPEMATIATAEYPVSRSLFFYVKDAHIDAIPGLGAYVEAFTQEEAIGPGGYLSERGLIPLPDADQLAMRERAQALANDPEASTTTPGEVVAASHTPRPLILVVGGLVLLILSAYYLGRARAIRDGATAARLHSLPSYYGYYAALWCGLPGLAAFALWLVVEPSAIEALIVAGLPLDMRAQSPARLGLILNDIQNLAQGNAFVGAADATLRAAAERYNALRDIGFAGLTVATLALASAGLLFGRSRVHADLRARIGVERTVRTVLLVSSTISIFVTVGIVLSLLFETVRFFDLVPLVDFLTGLKWSPQTAIREDQVGSTGAFGAVPLFAGTLLVTLIAMCVAVPIGLMSAIYLSEYAAPAMRGMVKPMLEILAGVPTVVYGFFAALVIAPSLRGLGAEIGLDVASESALAAGLVMGIMIIPFVSSISDDVINAVPQTLRDGAFALGATQSETVRTVIIPAALPGIVGGVLLAVSRAIGETMIVVMAAGLAANLTANPLEAVTTVTVQMVTLLVGDQEFDSAKTLAAFALGMVLFVGTLGLNILALGVVRKYREQYD